MAVPHTDLGDVGPTAVLIPLRSLHAGKLRLAEAIDPEGRAILIESMADTVVRAAHDLDVLIVHDDDDVASWAADRGAQALRPRRPGLNRAILEGQMHLRDAGYGRVIVAHADLPKARDLRILDTGHVVSIVPDRHGDGTNVMSLPTALEFTFAYGPGSFSAHHRVCRELGIEPHVVDAPDLAWDVDYPDDIPSHPEPQ